MNKNWFYRVLALALVAMLAVPMFAFAEEDVLATAAEAPAEELATALEGEEDVQVVSKRLLNGIDIYDIYLGYSVVEELPEINIDFEPFFQINLANADSNKKESFKSSNKKVATVSGTGFVTLVGAGNATITCTGYVDGKKKTTKFKIVVKDKTNAEEVNGHFFYVNDAPWVDDDFAFNDDGSEHLLENGKKYTKEYYIGMGFEADDLPTLIYEPVPFNDGDWVGQLYENGYSYKNSDAKVMFFDGNKHVGFNDAMALATVATGDVYDGSPVDKPFKASSKFWTLRNVADGMSADKIPYRLFYNHLLVPVFYKNGTNKLTIKTMATAGLKSYSYTNTFVIPKEKVTLRHGTDSELMKRAKHSEVVLYQIDTLDIQSMDKVVLTLKVYNGTDWAIPVKDVEFMASVTDGAIAAYQMNRKAEDTWTPFLQYGMDRMKKKDGTYGDTKRNVKVKGSIKPNKQTTLTITFENHRNGDFNIKSLSGRVVTGWDEVKEEWISETMTNFSESKKDALEIMAPYPDVWDNFFGFRIDHFTFKISNDHYYTPYYAFGEADGPVWIG